MLDVSGLLLRLCNRAVVDCFRYTPGSGLEKFLRPSNRFKAELGTRDLRKVKAALYVIKPRCFI